MKMGGGNKKGSKFEREFWKKVIKQARNSCWIWNGTILRSGYGQFWDGERRVLAHRYSMNLFLKKELKRTCLVLHRCDNKPCVNPGHLFVGSYQDNSTDMVFKGRSLFGSKANGVRLNEEKVKTIRNMYQRGKTLKQLGNYFKVHFTTIWLIVSGRTWRHVI